LSSKHIRRNRVAIGNYLLSLAVLLSVSAAGHAQSYMHVTVTATSGANQATLTNRLLPHPFVAQLTDDAGKPVAGVTLTFAVNGCAVFSGQPGGPQCPPINLYGSFATSDTTAVTDENGFATAPPFTAGSIRGSYDVVAIYFPWDQVVNGQTLTDLPLSGNNLFQITQVDPATTPTLSTWSTLFLILLITLAACVGLRTRRPIPHAN
jgi:hypothetical protein